MTEPLFDTRRHHRRRADRLVHRPRRAGRKARVRSHRGDRRARRQTRKRVVELGLADKVDGDQRRGRRRRRPRHRLRAGRRLRRGRRGDRSASQAGRHRLRRRLGEGLDRARHGPASAEDCALRAGASGRRHRAFRPRRGLCRIVRQPLVHPDAARRAPTRRPSRSSPPSGACSAPRSRP